jgi:hypothetical protein
MEKRIYDIKREVVSEIVKIDAAMNRAIYLMEHDRIFDPQIIRFFKTWKFEISSFGGLFLKWIKWEIEDGENYISREDE